MKHTKATIHRKQWRLWLQGDAQMAEAGFKANARYSVDYGDKQITLTLADDGKRKVSDTARGATIDLNNNALAKYNFSQGAVWRFVNGAIIITEEA